MFGIKKLKNRIYELEGNLAEVNMKLTQKIFDCDYKLQKICPHKFVEKIDGDYYDSVYKKNLYVCSNCGKLLNKKEAKGSYLVENKKVKTKIK